MEILNVRKTENGYLINGYIECVEGDNNYPNVLKWIKDKKEVMPLYTKEEIAKNLERDKWQKYSNYENDLTIDIVIDENTTHTYNASPKALLTIERKAVSAYTTEVSEILWVEDNDSFMTTKVELEMVILQADKLLQEKITELFGETE